MNANEKLNGEDDAKYQDGGLWQLWIEAAVAVMEAETMAAVADTGAAEAVMVVAATMVAAGAIITEEGVLGVVLMLMKLLKLQPKPSLTTKGNLHYYVFFYSFQ